MAVLSLMGYLSSKAIIQTSAGTEMSQCLSVAMGSIEMSLSNNRMVAETMARGVEAIQRQAVKGDQTASDWDAAAYQEILTSFVGSNPETFGPTSTDRSSGISLPIACARMEPSLM